MSTAAGGIISEFGHSEGTSGPTQDDVSNPLELIRRRGSAEVGIAGTVSVRPNGRLTSLTWSSTLRSEKPPWNYRSSSSSRLPQTRRRSPRRRRQQRRCRRQQTKTRQHSIRSTLEGATDQRGSWAGPRRPQGQVHRVGRSRAWCKECKDITVKASLDVRLYFQTLRSKSGELPRTLAKHVGYLYAPRTTHLAGRVCLSEGMLL
jgi:hypothetical protein